MEGGTRGVPGCNTPPSKAPFSGPACPSEARTRSHSPNTRPHSPPQGPDSSGRRIVRSMTSASSPSHPTSQGGLALVLYHTSYEQPPCLLTLGGDPPAHTGSHGYPVVPVIARFQLGSHLRTPPEAIEPQTILSSHHHLLTNPLRACRVTVLFTPGSSIFCASQAEFDRALFHRPAFFLPDPPFKLLPTTDQC